MRRKNGDRNSRREIISGQKTCAICQNDFSILIFHARYYGNKTYNLPVCISCKNKTERLIPNGKQFLHLNDLREYLSDRSQNTEITKEFISHIENNCSYYGQQLIRGVLKITCLENAIGRKFGAITFDRINEIIKNNKK